MAKVAMGILGTATTLACCIFLMAGGSSAFAEDVPVGKVIYHQADIGAETYKADTNNPNYDYPLRSTCDVGEKPEKPSATIEFCQVITKAFGTRDNCNNGHITFHASIDSERRVSVQIDNNQYIHEWDPAHHDLQVVVQVREMCVP
jgi:hypothetical protein